MRQLTKKICKAVLFFSDMVSLMGIRLNNNLELIFDVIVCLLLAIYC